MLIVCMDGCSRIDWKGDVEGTDSSDSYVWCLCVQGSFYVFVHGLILWI